jgi:hypothetical protein
MTHWFKRAKSAIIDSAPKKIYSWLQVSNYEQHGARGIGHGVENLKSSIESIFKRHALCSMHHAILPDIRQLTPET